MKHLPGTFAITTALITAALFALYSTVPQLAETSTKNSVEKSQKKENASIESVYLKRIVFWEKKLLIDPYSTASRVRLAQAHRELARATGDEGHFKRAENHLRDALKIHRGDKNEILVELADTIMAFHRFKEAWQLSNEVIVKEPNDWWVYGVRGDAALGMGNYELAKQDFEIYAQNDPGFSSYSRLAHIRHIYGDDSGARKLLESARENLRKTSLEPAAWIELRIGIHYLKKMLLPEAEEQFKRSLSVAPDYYLALEHLAEVHELRGDILKAKPLLERAIAIKPDSALILRLATIESEMGNKKKATALEQEAMANLLKQAQEDDAHVRDLAEVLVKREEQLPLALELLEKDLSLRPGDLRTHFLLAKTYRVIGDLERANMHIQQALRTRGGDRAYQIERQLIDNSLRMRRNV